MTLPNFLVIGAAKSGTTSLMQYLDQHPEVFMCPVKTHFFDLDRDPTRFCGSNKVSQRGGFIITELAEYEAKFEAAGEAIAIGETCDVYLSSEEAAQRIHHYIPHVKLIAVLRQPADRAFSAYTHMLRDGKETLAFAAALAQEPQRIAENYAPIWHYLRRGFYYEQIKMYMDLFGPDQMLVFLYDDLCEDAQSLLRDAFQFLGVDPEYQVDASIQYNVSGLPRSRTVHAIHDLITKPNRLKALVKTFVPTRRVRRIVRRFKNRLRMGNLQRPEFQAELRQSLIEDFREDILKLQNLLQRDLSMWLA